MITISEQLRFEVKPERRVELVLRSGQSIVGELEETDLIASVVRLDGWLVRIGKIAAVRAERADHAA